MRFSKSAFVIACLSASALADSEMTPEEFCAARTNTNVSEKDCLGLTDFAKAFQTHGNDATWENYITTTGSGYQISMVRITGNSAGEAQPTPKGPLLMTACTPYDGRVFTYFDDPTQPIVPVQLYEEGFDVWIANRRGTTYSAEHTSGDLMIDDPATYWDFDAENIAEEDYPQLIRTILETRRSESLPCKKVTIYSDGHSGLEMTLMHMRYPTSTKSWIAQQVNLTPCFIFEPLANDFFIDSFYEPAPTGPCVDDPESKECRNTWDTKAYRSKLNEVKKALSKEQLREFIKKFKDWTRENDDWKYGGKWETGINEILCEFTPEDPACAPIDYRRAIAFDNIFKDNGFHSLFGPPGVWEDLRDNYFCNPDVWQGHTCENFIVYPPIFTWQTTGNKELQFVAQNVLKNSVGRYDPNFADGGWYRERDLFDFSSVEIPMRSIFLGTDQFCAFEANHSNKAVLETIPGHSMSVIIALSDKTHFSIAGDNDPIMAGARSGLLSMNAGEDLAEDCSAIDFSIWN